MLDDAFVGSMNKQLRSQLTATQYSNLPKVQKQLMAREIWEFDLKRPFEAEMQGSYAIRIPDAWLGSHVVQSKFLSFTQYVQLLQAPVPCGVPFVPFHPQ